MAMTEDPRHTDTCGGCGLIIGGGGAGLQFKF
jgi:hypothetical protein